MSHACWRAGRVGERRRGSGVDATGDGRSKRGGEAGWE